MYLTRTLAGITALASLAAATITATPVARAAESTVMEAVACAFAEYRLDEITDTPMGREEIAQVVAERLERVVDPRVPQAVYTAVDTATGVPADVIWTVEDKSGISVAPRLTCQDETLVLEMPAVSLLESESVDQVFGLDTGLESYFAPADAAVNDLTLQHAGMGYDKKGFTLTNSGSYTHSSRGVRLDMRWEWYRRNKLIRHDNADRRVYVFRHEADYVRSEGSKAMKWFKFYSRPKHDDYRWYDVEPGGQISGPCTTRSFGIDVGGYGVSTSNTFCETYTPDKLSPAGSYLMEWRHGGKGTKSPREGSYLDAITSPRSPTFYVSAYAYSS